MCDNSTIPQSSRHDYSEQLEYSLVDCCDKMRERIESYHIQLCQTCLLQDKDSNDWTSSQPFFEVGSTPGAHSEFLKGGGDGCVKTMGFGTYSLEKKCRCCEVHFSQSQS